MIYISSPPEGLPLPTARENIKVITDKLLSLGLFIINPLNLGIPNNWLQKEKDDKRKDVIFEKASAIFLQKDWNKSETAKKEFLAVHRQNAVSGKSRYIQIYFEDFHGFTDIESDVINGILSCTIPD